MELLDEGFVQLGGLFDNTSVVLEGQGEPNIAVRTRLVLILLEVEDGQTYRRLAGRR